MGAWGTNFFESEWDLDLASDFYEPAGLAELESEAKEKVRQSEAQSGAANATTTNDAAEADEDDYDDLPILSVHAAQCADVDRVREHLDAGVLRKLIDEWKAKMEPTDEAANMAAFHKAYYTYQFILLGACAMTLGCKLPDDFKELLINKYRNADLKRDQLHSMQRALSDGPQRYKGVPYDFASPGPVETVDSSDSEDDEDSGCPSAGMNEPGPFGFFRGADQGLMKEYPANVCGGCGAADRLDGEPLLCCKKCKVKKYCSKVCQQAHFDQHKGFCKKSESALEMMLARFLLAFARYCSEEVPRLTCTYLLR